MDAASKASKGLVSDAAIKAARAVAALRAGDRFDARWIAHMRRANPMATATEAQYAAAYLAAIEARWPQGVPVDESGRIAADGLPISADQRSGRDWLHGWYSRGRIVLDGQDRIVGTFGAASDAAIAAQAPELLDKLDNLLAYLEAGNAEFTRLAVEEARALVDAIHALDRVPAGQVGG